jgi:hypothetical protein
MTRSSFRLTAGNSKYVGHSQKVLALVGFSETGVTNVPNRKFHVAAVLLPREAPAQLLGEVQVRAIDVDRFIYISG